MNKNSNLKERKNSSNNNKSTMISVIVMLVLGVAGLIFGIIQKQREIIVISILILALSIPMCIFYYYKITQPKRYINKTTFKNNYEAILSDYFKIKLEDNLKNCMILHDFNIEFDDPEITIISKSENFKIWTHINKKQMYFFVELDSKIYDNIVMLYEDKDADKLEFTKNKEIFELFEEFDYLKCSDLKTVYQKIADYVNNKNEVVKEFLEKYNEALASYLKDKENN